MIIKLKDKTEIKIDRLNCTLCTRNGANGAYDDFTVESSELNAHPLSYFQEKFTPENVSDVTYKLDSGKTLKRNYHYVASVRYVFSDENDFLNVSLSEVNMEESELNED